MPAGSGVERCYKTFRKNEASIAGTAWVAFADDPNYIAFEVTFDAPEKLACRFVFGLPEHLDCLEAVVAVRLLTLSPTAGRLPIDPEAGMFFERIDVAKLLDFL